MQSSLVLLKRLTLLCALPCVALVLLVSGCGDDDPAPGCARDADCRGSRVCQDGQCIDDSASNATTSNETSGMSNGTATSNGTTATSNGTSGCLSDQTCPAGQVCDQGECGERTCGGDADCASPDRFCFGGICQPDVPCTDDSACASFGADWTCTAGICQPGCDVDADCPDPQTQTCVNSECVSRCIGDQQCGDGQVCVDNVCTSPECANDNDCGDNERCEGNQCEAFTPCETEDDCAAEEQCLNNICEPRTACIGDQQCASDEQCVDNLCFPVEQCTTRDDCSEGLDCVAGRCVPFVCRGPADCDEGQLCEGGECVDPEEDAAVATVVILTESQTIIEGQDIAFLAVALDARNAIIPGQAIAWSSSNPDVADIDGDSGEAIGGSAGGITEITAMAVGTDIASDSVLLNNPGAAPADMDRVTVVDSRTGAPVSGATVARGEITATTGDDGQALFETDDGANTITAFAEGYNYVTLMSVSSSDVIIPLPIAEGGGSIAGFTGELDTSEVTSGGDVTLGLAGASLSRDLASIDLASILGDPFSTQVSVPGLFEADLPLPGGLVLYGTVFGFPITVKETYYARTRGGLKVGWAFGGNIDVATLLPVVMGGGADLSNLLPILLPLFENFDHGLKTVTLNELPLAADTDDIDADGNTSELLPDYEEFPIHDLKPNITQSLRTGLQLTTLPNLPGDGGTLAITVGGILTEGIGFVPQGLNITQDEDGDGITDRVILRQAPAHSGLSVGEYAIVAIAFDSSGFGVDLENGLSLPEDLSAVFWTGSDIPQDLSLDNPFLDAPTADWNAPNRSFSGEGALGASLYRVTFVGDGASWEVWLSADDLAFTLPQPPEGFSDWSANSAVRFEAFATRDGLELDAIAEANASRLNNLNAVMTGFSRIAVSE